MEELRVLYNKRTPENQKSFERKNANGRNIKAYRLGTICNAVGSLGPETSNPTRENPLAKAFILLPNVLGCPPCLIVQTGTSLRG